MESGDEYNDDVNVQFSEDGRILTGDLKAELKSTESGNEAVTEHGAPALSEDAVSAVRDRGGTALLELWRPAGVNLDNGRMYYFNTETFETAWERPSYDDALCEVVAAKADADEPPPPLSGAATRTRSLTLTAAFDIAASDQLMDSGIQLDNLPPYFFRAQIDLPVIPTLTKDSISAAAERTTADLTQMARGGWIRCHEVIEATERCWSRDLNGAQKWFARIEGRGWVAEADDEQGTLGLERIAAERGVFTYRVCHAIAVRATASLDKSAIRETFGNKITVLQVGSVIKAEMRVAADGVVFIQLAGEGGWLFTSKDGVVTLRPVLVEEGHWNYRVVQQTAQACSFAPPDHS